MHMVIRLYINMCARVYELIHTSTYLQTYFTLTHNHMSTYLLVNLCVR